MTKVVTNPEVATVALASLTKLVRLLGAELVAGTHRDDIDLFEKCVREKLHANVDGISSEATAAGVALAHSLVEPVLRALRAQAQEATAPKTVTHSAFAGPASKLH
jgi:hypothetical protein